MASDTRKKAPAPETVSSNAQPTYRDNADLTDPGPRGGPLGAEDELPEGGDSTRFPPRVKEQLEQIRRKPGAA